MRDSSSNSLNRREEIVPSLLRRSCVGNISDGERPREAFTRQTENNNKARKRIASAGPESHITPQTSYSSVANTEQNGALLLGEDKRAIDGMMLLENVLRSVVVFGKDIHLCALGGVLGLSLPRRADGM